MPEGWSLVPSSTTRAIQKAQVLGPPAVEVLECRLGQECYGVELGWIQEVIIPQAVTPVPRAPSYVKGIFSLRGAIVTVVDLRARFGWNPQVATTEGRYVLVRQRTLIVGLLVDAVGGAIVIPEDQIEPPPPGLGEHARFIKGIGHHQGGLVILLDIKHLLGSLPSHTGATP